jgi:hypothetical protein
MPNERHRAGLVTLKPIQTGRIARKLAGESKNMGVYLH